MTWSRRNFMQAGAALGFDSPNMAAQPPNVVLILADDLGSADLGCQGATDVKTPHIDEIAASGVRFTNWYSPAPVCAPARGALMTGRYPLRNGVVGNGRDLPRTEVTVANVVKSRRYSTGVIGKWHLGQAQDTHPLSRGFDSFYGFHTCIDYFSHRNYWGEPKTVNYHDLWRDRTEIFEDGQYFTDLVTREAVRFIEANRSRPFFLYLPYSAVHYPMHAPDKYVKRFEGLEPERRTYAAMLSALDDGVGAVRSALRRHGLLDNTLVIFTSDNGATAEPRAGLNQKPARGGRNLPHRGWKFSAFDGGMHVAGMMSWPARLPKGRVSDEIVSHLDLLPTIAAATSSSVPSDRTIDGRNILGVAEGREKSPHHALYWDWAGQQAVRRGKWKLVRNGSDYDGAPTEKKTLTGEDAVFLSDMDADPGETQNVRRKHPELTDDLLTRMAQWRKTVTEK